MRSMIAVASANDEGVVAESAAWSAMTLSPRSSKLDRWPDHPDSSAKQLGHELVHTATSVGPVFSRKTVGEVSEESILFEYWIAGNGNR